MLIFLKTSIFENILALSWDSLEFISRCQRPYLLCYTRCCYGNKIDLLQPACPIWVQLLRLIFVNYSWLNSHFFQSILFINILIFDWVFIILRLHPCWVQILLRDIVRWVFCAFNPLKLLLKDFTRGARSAIRWVVGDKSLNIAHNRL